MCHWKLLSSIGQYIGFQESVLPKKHDQGTGSDACVHGNHSVCLTDTNNKLSQTHVMFPILSHKLSFYGALFVRGLQPAVHSLDGQNRPIMLGCLEWLQEKHHSLWISTAAFRILYVSATNSTPDLVWRDNFLCCTSSLQWVLIPPQGNSFVLNPGNWYQHLLRKA